MAQTLYIFSDAPSSSVQMAPFLKPFIALMAIAALADVAICANYTVGAPGGLWDLNTDYEQWAKGLKFYTGDYLIFRYTSFHDVAEVTKDAYTSCSSSTTLTIAKSGTTVIELKAFGTRYFICAVPTHCSGGMKVQINVASKPLTPTPKPPTLPPASPPRVNRPPATPLPASPPPAKPPTASPNNAAIAQHGVGMFANFVLGLIGLMLAML